MLIFLVLLNLFCNLYLILLVKRKPQNKEDVFNGKDPMDYLKEVQKKTKELKK